MCSLNHAIRLYQEDKKYIIVKEDNKPINNQKFSTKEEEADIDRIYYQCNNDEKLSVVSI